MTSDPNHGDPSLYKYDSQAEEDEVFMVNILQNCCYSASVFG